MLDSLRPFVIPALSAKGQKLAFVTRGPFSCRRRRRRHGRGAGRHKSGDCVPARRVKRTGTAGCGTGTQIISTGTVFQCAPTAADPAAAAGANLRKLGLNGMFSTGREFFVRRCAPRAAVFLYSKRGSRCMAENFYQLALRTPGIWPLYASSRKQIRQMP